MQLRNLWQAAQDFLNPPSYDALTCQRSILDDRARFWAEQKTRTFTLGAILHIANRQGLDIRECLVNLSPSETIEIPIPPYGWPDEQERFKGDGIRRCLVTKLVMDWRDAQSILWAQHDESPIAVDAFLKTTLYRYSPHPDDFSRAERLRLERLIKRAEKRRNHLVCEN